jgi:hypothetical protein
MEIADAQGLSCFGIKADGVTDDTGAIQKALDATAKTEERCVLAAARYLVAGSLTIPPGVSLEGVHDAPVGQGPLTGTVILTTGGRDKEDAPAPCTSTCGRISKPLEFCRVYQKGNRPPDTSGGRISLDAAFTSDRAPASRPSRFRFGAATPRAGRCAESR